MPQNADASANYNRKNGRLDHFWMKIISDSKKYDGFLKFVKIILILSCGNAALERGSSGNKDCLVENQAEASLIAQRIVYDKIKSCGGIKKVEITKASIQYAREAHSAYLDANRVKNFEAEQEKKEKETRKRKADKIKNLEKEKAEILKEANQKARLLTDKIISISAAPRKI